MPRSRRGSAWHLLEMQILRPQPRPESETLGADPMNLCCNVPGLEMAILGTV